MTPDSGKTRKLHEDYALIGKIGKPHGLKGEIKAFSFSQRPESFSAYKSLLLVDPESGVERRFNVILARSNEKTAILHLEGVTGRNEAEALGGLQIWLLKTDLPVLEQGEYYWHEMTGARVITDDGRELGVVSEIFNNKVYDILVVLGQGREYLIPVRDEIVRSIDRETHTLIVSPMPGLLDLNS